MRTRSRVARSVLVVVALAVVLLLGNASSALASSPGGGFCYFWGPNYSYVLPDGSIISCG
jgi:hypothetical protein